MNIVLAAQVIIIMGLPASALLGIGIWAFRRDSRAPIQAVAILLIGLGGGTGAVHAGDAGVRGRVPSVAVLIYRATRWRRLRHGTGLLTERRGQAMMYYIGAGAQIIILFGLPASALLGAGIWALRRDLPRARSSGRCPAHRIGGGCMAGHAADHADDPISKSLMEGSPLCR